MPQVLQNLCLATPESKVYVVILFSPDRSLNFDLGTIRCKKPDLEQIEQGKIDQHEASVKVGTHLKELYIDSALKKAEKNDAKEKDNETNIEFENITWNDFKQII